MARKLMTLTVAGIVNPLIDVLTRFELYQDADITEAERVLKELYAEDGKSEEITALIEAIHKFTEASR